MKTELRTISLLLQLRHFKKKTIQLLSMLPNRHQECLAGTSAEGADMRYRDIKGPSCSRCND